MKHLTLIMLISNYTQPFIQTIKYFGLCLRLHTNRLTIVYSLLVLLGDSAYFIFNILQRPEHGGLREWIFVCQNMFYASMCFFSHLLFLINSTDVNKYYLETLSIVKQFSDVNSQKIKTVFRLEFMFSFTVLSFMYGLTLFGTYLHYVQQYKYMMKDAYGHLMHYIFTYLMFVVEIIFVNFVLLVKQCFIQVNQSIDKLNFSPAGEISVLQDKQIKEKSIRKFAYLHFTLCTIIKSVNGLFSFQLGITYLAIFVEITFSMYFITITIIDFKIDSDGVKLFALYLIPWAYYHCIKLILISSVCEGIEKEIKRSAFLIHKVAHFTTKSETISEIQDFSLQILHWDFKFTACNFFSVNGALITTIVSAVCTYLIILVQFQQSQK